jgi:Sec-independent protein secretion pathway component TatC
MRKASSEMGWLVSLPIAAVQNAAAMQPARNLLKSEENTITGYLHAPVPWA